MRLPMRRAVGEQFDDDDGYVGRHRPDTAPVLVDVGDGRVALVFPETRKPTPAELERVRLALNGGAQ